jgi:hypothetical protein
MVARCHTTVTGEWLVLFYVHQMCTSAASRAVVLNKFRDMEKDVVDALKPLLPLIYNVGLLTRAQCVAFAGARSRAAARSSCC